MPDLNGSIREARDKEADVLITLAASPRASLRQRCFARFMARQDAINFEMYRDKKRVMLNHLRGTIVELGPGTGVNLQFFSPEVHWIGVEPNVAMHPHLRRTAWKLGLDITLYPTTLEGAPIEDGTVDVVISTLVLCSVPSVAVTLAEIRRVLRPGGTFVFLEHVVGRRRSLCRFLQKLAPFTPYRFFGDGCDPGRDIGGHIAAAGFTAVHQEAYIQQVPVFLRLNIPHIFGTAVR